MTSTAQNSVWIQDLTWKEVESYLGEKQTVIVPIGATEQHGPAGPLGLDSYVAITLAEDAAQRSGVLCSPPIWFGDSSHHGAFPGTISLRTETVTALIMDVCASLVNSGFREIIIINGHKGSNLPALTTAIRDFREQAGKDALIAIADPLHLAKTIAKDIKSTNEHHAGELELSHIMYRYPGLVREDLLADQGVDFQEHFGEFVSDDLFGAVRDTVDIVWTGEEERRFAPSGSLSSAQEANVERGKTYHDHIVTKMVDLISWMRSYTGIIANRDA